MFPAPSPSSELVAAFVVLAVGVLAMGVVGLEVQVRAGVLAAKSSGRALLGVGLWVMLVAGLSARGVLARDVVPPPLVGLLVLMLFGCARVVRSEAGRALGALPVGVLILAQGFRLPLELAMHQAATEGVMPPQMTWTGWNLDVLTGLTALVVGPLAVAGRAPRWLLLAWNTLGTALLVTVIVVAVVSTPVFSAFGPDRLNTFVAFLPFVFLPTVMVPTAIVGHALIWRRLLATAG